MTLLRAAHRLDDLLVRMHGVLLGLLRSGNCKAVLLQLRRLELAVLLLQLGAHVAEEGGHVTLRLHFDQSDGVGQSCGSCSSSASALSDGAAAAFADRTTSPSASMRRSPLRYSRSSFLVAASSRSSAVVEFCSTSTPFFCLTGLFGFANCGCERMSSYSSPTSSALICALSSRIPTRGRGAVIELRELAQRLSYCVWVRKN